MVLVPLSTFYFLYYIVFQQKKDTLGICGLAAVIATNFVIAAYVIMAWNEDSRTVYPKKQELPKVD
jgi:hypothetical protein